MPLSALTHSLESEGYEVHTQLEDPEGLPLEDIEGTEEDRENEFLRRLQAVADSDDPKKVLILKNSHIGGHKYSGNVVVSFRYIIRVLDDITSSAQDLHTSRIGGMVWSRITTRDTCSC